MAWHLAPCGGERGTVRCRDEDHLALMQELLGRMPRRISGTGRRARRFFTRAGDLRHIRSLRMWPLPEVLQEKYGFQPAEVPPSPFLHYLTPLPHTPLPCAAAPLTPAVGLLEATGRQLTGREASEAEGSGGTLGS